MELSTIKNTINSFANETVERVKGNWNNLSTTGKVAAIATSVLFAGAAVAAQFFSAGLLSAVTALSIGASHIVAHVATAALGALGLTIPAFLVLKKGQAKPNVVKEEIAQEKVVVKQPAVQQETLETAKDTVKPSRLVNLKNASVQFVQNHPRLVIAGSVLAIGVLSAGLMGAQRRGAVVSYSKAAIQGLPKNKEQLRTALVSSKEKLGKTLSDRKTVVKNSFVRVQNRLGFAKK